MLFLELPYNNRLELKIYNYSNKIGVLLFMMIDFGLAYLDNDKVLTLVII